MKSVLNWISNIHQFYPIFIPFLAIFLELRFDFWIYLNPGISWHGVHLLASRLFLPIVCAHCRGPVFRHCLAAHADAVVRSPPSCCCHHACTHASKRSCAHAHQLLFLSCLRADALPHHHCYHLNSTVTAPSTALRPRPDIQKGARHHPPTRRQ
jgi:hypothetical protein